MKVTVWSIAILLVVVLGIGIISGICCENVTSEYRLKAQAVQAAVNQEDWETALTKLDEMRTGWDKVTTWLELFINHNETDDVALALRKLQTGLELQEKWLSLLAVDEVLDALHRINQREELTLTNLI